MSATLAAAFAAAAACLLASPYLARLTRTVPDRAARRWWIGAPVSRRRTILVAAIAVAAGLLAGAAAPWRAELPALLVLALVSTPLIVIDVEHQRLPDRLVLVAAVAGAVLLTAAGVARGSWFALARGGICASAVFLALLALALLSPTSFGLGDVKLGAVLGGYLGWFGWGFAYAGIAAGFLLGALVAVALLATRRAGLKTQLPFGPMLIAGALLVLAVHGVFRGG